MSTARTSTLATLRGSIERIEAPCDAHDLNKVALGHAAADTTLCGGLALAAVHEVFAEGHQSAAATGFIAGLAGRVSPRRPLVWVRQGFSEIESGAPAISRAFGLGPDPPLPLDRRWIMEWKCDECLFNEPAAYPQPVAATPAHRPHQAQAFEQRRRAS